ncbi:beta-glycosyltransferase/ family 2 [Synechococcus sp. A15-62]|uniref:TIGR04283 family arsenosugar biosynthesis glycosyltransferase n=1 Tax=Synechococcus sp. A15-62 TaxID=1050657 RepID=UPI001646B129|nr:TIGR04283 family arsenosugar biosynthesis glycosyltransferase [Synechococcus sp. A15-62]QNI99814.1 beta-glycosyltransferase/ family 2 [Synechococcus sp. A15-62]
MAGLSVVIPTLEEASRLPLLLADLQQWPGDLEVIVSDAGSRDQTRVVAQLAGASVLDNPHAGRGPQLRWGVDHSSHAWVLVLHADSRLPGSWHQKVVRVLNRPEAHLSAWFFNFNVDAEGRPMLWLLKRMVNLRSHWLQRPYGDQGLLIQRQLYERVGGYRPLALMEDLDLVERLSKVAPLRSLNCSLLTSAERWQSRSVLMQAWRNARLRWLWRQGRSTEQLLRIYRR